MAFGSSRVIISTVLSLILMAEGTGAAILTGGNLGSLGGEVRRDVRSVGMQVGSWYTMEDGREFTVIRYSRDGKQVKIAFDGEEGEGEVVTGWYRTEEVLRSEPKVVDIAAIEALADIGIVVEKVRGRRGGRGGMTYCLRDVRIRATQYTAGRNIPQNILMASLAYPKYKAKGWERIEYSANVPNGTACFFGGGRRCGRSSRCGHAAIKIGPNRWLGAGVTPTPFLRNRSDNGRVPYSFHGCLTPPGLRSRGKR